MNDSQDTFESAKKEVLNKLWNFVPKRLRIPFVIVVLILGAVVATKSYWMPVAESIYYKKPAPFIFSGYIYADAATALKTEVQLLDNKGEKISQMTSDSTGFVTFNILSDKKIASILVSKKNEWIQFPVDFDKLKKSQGFKIYLSEQRLEIP